MQYDNSDCLIVSIIVQLLWSMFNIIRSFLRNNSSINYKFGYSKPVKATKNPFTGKNVATMEIKDKKLTLSAVANNLNLSENFLRKQMINPMTDTITE